ncbi:MAG TPA: isochorismatase family cysteine hydrolase [Mycobacteriales bacterium]|nr:isochorismatase family cysteine hydrolase [Mycobacteriales bacterium]
MGVPRLRVGLLTADSAGPPSPTGPGAPPWAGLVDADEVAAVAARGRAERRPLQAGHRPALLVVDMTRAFVQDSYPTNCNAWGGRAATSACVRVLATARSAGTPVLFARAAQGPGRHRMDSPELLATPPGLPDGNEIAEELAPRPGEVVFGKPGPSAFYGSPLDAYLTYLSVDTLVVVGMVTSGCVRATVVDAYTRNLLVLVPHACVADYSWFQHRSSLFDMHMKYADVCEVEQAEQVLRR